MAEAALPKAGSIPTEIAKGNEKPKRGQITRGRIMPQISNPAKQAEAVKALWDYNFGRKSNFYQKPAEKNGDESEIPSFQVDETDPDLKSSFESTKQEENDTVHDEAWIKEQMGRRRHKNYHSPVSMEITDAARAAQTGKSFNETTEKDVSDVSVLSETQAKKQQALRRRKNYRSPGNASLVVSFDKENMKEELKEVQKELNPVRRDTFAPLRDYSAVLEGLGNTTERSSRGTLDASKKSDVVSKNASTLSKKLGKNQQKQKKASVFNSAGLEISDIVDSNSERKIGTRSRVLNASVDEDTENLRAMGLPAANKAWKDIATSTPLSTRPPTGPLTGTKASEKVTPPAPRVFQFEVVQEADINGDEFENKKDATMTEEMDVAEGIRRRDTIEAARGQELVDGPPEADVPTDDESALPEPAEAIVPFDRSASANDLTIEAESAVAEEEPSTRSAPPTPTQGRRYPMRVRKKKVICRMCDEPGMHY